MKLGAGLENNGRGRPVAVLAAILAQTPQDVVDLGDDIVDDRRQGRHQAGHNHDVDGCIAQGKHQPCGHQRQGNGDDADQRGAPREEPGAERNDQEETTDCQRHAEIVDCRLDEGIRTEDGCIDLDTGQTLP